MRIQDIIAKKRDGGALAPGEIGFFVQAYTRGDLPDYQAAALLMAIYLRGMERAETALLTAAMADSGRRLDLSALPRPTLDKHSTGGVGDKTTLVVVPMLAAAGVPVCKMSGRGLGHTGGTLDKLESIPGFRVALTPDEMVAQVARIGACLAGQTEDLAPADRKLYALRDATATVASLPLIVSSILSKKLAGGADTFLFDVKVGSGALVRTPAAARELAQALVDGAAAHGRRAVALLTDMNQPLGAAIGNALEVREAVATLTPGAAGGAARFRALCVALCAEGLTLAGKSAPSDAVPAAERLLDSGAARAALREIVAAQGGDASVIDDPALLPSAPVVVPVAAPRAGYLAGVDAAALGAAVVRLGGGRGHKEDRIDPAVGITIRPQVGEHVAAGETLVEIHARSEAQAASVAREIRAAFTFRGETVPPPPLIHGRVASEE